MAKRVAEQAEKPDRHHFYCNGIVGRIFHYGTDPWVERTANGQCGKILPFTCTDSPSFIFGELQHQGCAKRTQRDFFIA